LQENRRQKHWVRRPRAVNSKVDSVQVHYAEDKRGNKRYQQVSRTLLGVLAARAPFTLRQRAQDWPVATGNQAVSGGVSDQEVAEGSELGRAQAVTALLHIPAQQERVIWTGVREEGGLGEGHEADFQLNKRKDREVQLVVKQALRAAVRLHSLWWTDKENNQAGK
jgi:hypothetical protein